MILDASGREMRRGIGFTRELVYVDSNPSISDSIGFLIGCEENLPFEECLAAGNKNRANIAGERKPK